MDVQNIGVRNINCVGLADNLLIVGKDTQILQEMIKELGVGNTEWK